MITRLTKWMLAGSLSGFTLGVVDSAALYLTARNMFFQTSEMLMAMLFSLATCAAGGAVMSLPGFILETGLVRIPKKWRPFAAAAVLAPFSIALTWLLTRGPQASAIPARTLVVSVAGALMAVAGGFAIVKTSAVSKQSHRLGLAAMGVAAAAILIFADFNILVRLYLPFHAALSILAFVLIAGGIRLLWQKPEMLRHRVTGVVLALVIVIGGGVSLMQIRGTQNIRFVISEKTATAADLVLLAKTLAPPPEDTLLDETIADPPVEVTAPQRASQLRLPGASVLLVTVDAMRFDRLQPGKMDNIAPTINALGKESVIFERAYTALPHTSYAVASFITGKYIKPLFDIPEVTADQETWPEIMRRFRYRTGGFFTRSVFFIDRTKFKPLENKGYGFGWLKMEYRFTAEQKVNQALEFLKKVKPLNQPVFTWVHLFEPHEPYKETCTRFGTSDEQRYNCEIFTADQQIKRLMDYVEEFYPGTIIVVAADHGEEFTDHGGRYHGTTLYDEQVRVPLLMRVPGVPHRVVTEPVNLVDILGTVLSIVDIPVPPRVRSNNLTGLLLGTDTEKKAAFAQLHERRMVVFDSHKLIWDKSSDLVRLYDLTKDPGETISVADQKPQMVSLLRKKIAGWEASHAKMELRPVTTDDGVQSWPAVVQKALGGDETVTSDLLQYLSSDIPEVVRQKAAELLFERWRSDLPPVPFDQITDPVCLAWLWSALAKSSDDALPHLRQLSPQLERLSPPWIRVQLSRLALRDSDAATDVIEIANANSLAPAIRVEAIRLLGNNNVALAETSLLALLNNYLLRQDVAVALAQLKTQNAIAPLRTHLEAEPFASRRSELAEALVHIAGKKALKDIARQMETDSPISNGLSLLASINAVPPKQTILTDKPSEKHMALISGTALNVRASGSVLVHFQLPADAPSVQVRCNDQIGQTLQNVAANTLQTLTLNSCNTGDTTISIHTGATPAKSALLMAVW